MEQGNNKSQKLKELLHLSDIELGKIKAFGSGGIEYACRIYIAREGYIPDVYVQFKSLAKGGVSNSELYDDEIFIQCIMNHLTDMGYQGPDFSRAELGMQGDDFIVLEPVGAFYAFAKQKGFRNLGK